MALFVFRCLKTKNNWFWLIKNGLSKLVSAGCCNSEESLIEYTNNQNQLCYRFLMFLDYLSEHFEFVSNYIMFVSQCQGSFTDSILQESYERRFESQLQMDKQAEHLQAKLLEQGKKAIDQQFHKKIKQASVKYKNLMNKLTNEHQLQRLNSRYSQCCKIFEQLEHKLKSFSTQKSTHNQYKHFLAVSILEGLVRLFEEKVFIRCLEQDKQTIQNLLPQIRQLYRNFMKSQIGFQYPLQIQIANNLTLSERFPEDGPLDKNKEDLYCVGGVILADITGNITFKATLDSRLNILKDISLPLLRSIIWNQKDAITQ